MLRKIKKEWAKVVFIAIIAVVVISCGNEDKSRGSNFDPENVFFDYKISGREADDKLTVLLQFREGGEKGHAISLADWGTVTLDGEELPGDSTKRTGFFYETNKPIVDFSGKHVINLLGNGKEEYKEEFVFERVELLTALPDTLNREELVLEFSGLYTEDYLRVLLIDTSVVNEGINRVDSLQNGRLIITAEDLQKLDSGPIQLLFFRELEKPTKNSTNSGGRILITYSLSREFYLKD